MMRRLAELESDLAIKENQLARLPVLQTQLKQLVDGREELQMQFERAEVELEQKNKQLKMASEHQYGSISDLQAALVVSKTSHESLQVKLRQVENELASQRAEASRQCAELKVKLEAAEREIALQTKVRSTDTEHLSKAHLNSDALSRAKSSLEAKIRMLEEDRADREAQVKQSSERYSNQILELQMKVEELSRTKITLTSRLSRLEADLEQKDEVIGATSQQLSNEIAALQTKLGERLAENESLKEKLEGTEAQRVESQAATEIQMKLDAEAKEKRSLLSRLGDVEAELERKEKQIKDIVDRYTREIADVQCKLDDEQRANAALQKDLDRLTRGESNVSSSAIARLAKEQVEKALASQQRETAALQMELEHLRSVTGQSNASSNDRVAELTQTNSQLQKEMEHVKARAEERERHLEDQLVQAMGFSGDTSRDVTELEEKLLAIEQSKADLEERFRKVQGERAEVMNALGDLIGEVQSRDDEIEALALILKKRDEELEHAKLIATKALASAQDLKARCRSLESGRQADMSEKISELNSSVEYLTKTNEGLERKTSKMERVLQEREKECNELHEQLKRKEKVRSRLSERLDEKKLDDDGFQSIDGGFPTFETVTASPTTRASSLVLNDSMSSQSEEAHGATGWLHDFSSQSNDSDDESASFAEVRSKASSTQSRKAIERDAMRKYVRSKYMKSKGSL
jgi:chromosome segregation ATPase